MPKYEVGRAQTIEGYARGTIEADTPEEALRLARDKYRDGSGFDKEETVNAEAPFWTLTEVGTEGVIIESTGDEHPEDYPEPERNRDDTLAVKCDNCQWDGMVMQLGKQLSECADLTQRLDPGGTVPAGECPKCGAFAYLKP